MFWISNKKIEKQKIHNKIPHICADVCEHSYSSRTRDMSYKIRKLTNFLIKRQFSTSATMVNSLGDIVEKLNSFAATKTAENWDNVGLLIEPATPKYVNIFNSIHMYK